MRTSTARKPVGRVYLNATSVDFIEFDLETNAFADADTATVVIPIKSLPPELDLRALTTAPKIEMEVWAGFPAEQSAPQHLVYERYARSAPAEAVADRIAVADRVVAVSGLDFLFVGNVDSLTLDLDGGAVTLRARDLTAGMMETKVSERFTNYTASRLAEELAAKHGLVAFVTPTTTRIGTFDRIDHVRINQRRSEWDILTWVAREEDFIVYVDARTLVFGPRPSSDQEPFVVEWRAPIKPVYPSADFTSMRFDREPPLENIKVIVRSWNHRQGVRYERSAGSTEKDAREHEYSIPGLTAEQTQARANQIHAELTQHTMRVSVDGPVDEVEALSVADVIEVRGTSSAFDQVYYVDSIRRRFSASEGYAWAIEAKNKSRGLE